jgi:hypothetical protein
MAEDNKFENNTSMMGLGASVDAEFWIEGLLEQGSVTTLAGAPGTGKTALMLQLTESIMTGKEFHGLTVTHTADALWIQYDSTHNQFERYCARYCPGLKFEALTLSSKAKFTLKVWRDVELLVDYCHRNGIGMVIMDSLSAISRGYDENNNNDMDAVYERFTQLANSDISVIVLHHMSKSEYGPQKNMRGASSILASTHNAWSTVRARYGIDFSVTKSREIPCGLMFTFDIGKDYIRRVEHVKAEDNRIETVIDLITEHGEMTRAQLQEASGIHTKGLQDILDKVAAMPIFEKAKSGKADVYKYIGK